MTAARLAGIAVLVLSLGGCPFTADTPLSDPAAARLDPDIVGTWRTRDGETGEWNALTILPFNGREMVGFTPGGSPGKIDAFRLFVTDIGADRFLNFRQVEAQDTGASDGGWSFAKYRVVDNRLFLSVVDDGLFENGQFATAAELREFFRQHLSDPRLYAADDEQSVETVWEHVHGLPGDAKPKS
jgi:hypothetical protein